MRYEFDKWPLNFKETEVRLITPNIIPQEDDKEYQYVKRDPNFITLTNICEYSEHIVKLFQLAKLILPLG